MRPQIDDETLATRYRAIAVLLDLAENTDADEFARLNAANIILCDDTENRRIDNDFFNEENKRRLDEAEKLAAELKTELERMQK